MAWSEQELHAHGYRVVKGDRAVHSGERKATPARDLHGESEETFRQRLREVARLLGYTCYHTHDSRRSDEGFPDEVLVRPRTPVRPGRLLFVECKRDDGKVAPAQLHWLALLRGSVEGVEVYVWRPRDWVELVEILGADTARREYGGHAAQEI